MNFFKIIKKILKFGNCCTDLATIESVWVVTETMGLFSYNSKEIEQQLQKTVSEISARPISVKFLKLAGNRSKLTAALIGQTPARRNSKIKRLYKIDLLPQTNDLIMEKLQNNNKLYEIICILIENQQYTKLNVYTTITEIYAKDPRF